MAPLPNQSEVVIIISDGRYYACVIADRFEFESDGEARQAAFDEAERVLRAMGGVTQEDADAAAGQATAENIAGYIIDPSKLSKIILEMAEKDMHEK